MLIHVREVTTNGVTTYQKTQVTPSQEIDIQEGDYFIFVGPANANGTVSIKFTASDGSKSTAEKTLKIIIDAKNDQPTEVSLSGQNDAVYQTTGDSTTPKLSEAGYVIVDGEIRQLDKHGNSSSPANGSLGAKDIEDDTAAERDAINSGKPFTLQGKDAGYFKVVKTGSGNSAVWTLVGKTDKELKDAKLSRKDAGESYQIILVFTDSDGASVTQTVTIIQGVGESGLYLQSTVDGPDTDTDGSGSDTDEDAPETNAKEYSEGHMHVLSQNRGGPTLAEDVKRRSDREADGDTLTYSLSVTDSANSAVSGNLGLRINASGLLTGTLPSSGLAAGNYTVTVSASDGAGTSATKSMTITVNAPAPQPVAPSQPAVTNGSDPGKQDLRGDSNANIFTIDSTASVRNNADTITNFGDGSDKIKFANHAGAIATNGNKVSWQVETSGDKTNIIIYAGDTVDASKILAVIEDFTGTFDTDDFEGLGTTVTAAMARVTHLGTIGKDSFVGTNGVSDIFTVDMKGSPRADGDVISGFKVLEDKIAFSPANGDQYSYELVAREVETTRDGKTVVDTHFDIKASNILDNKTLFIINDYTIDTGQMPQIALDNFVAAVVENISTSYFVIEVFRKDNSSSDPSFIITSGTADDRQDLWDTTSVVDCFLLDSGTSTAAKADWFSRGFDATMDKIVLAEDVDKVIAKVEGANTILYKDTVGDNNVLAVIDGFVATSANFTIDDFLLQPNQDFTVGFEVL